MPWSVSQFRVTVFPDPSGDQAGLPSWELLKGVEPTRVVRQAGVTTEEGEHELGVLVLARQPGQRVDLVYGMTPARDPNSSLIDRSLGPLGQASSAVANSVGQLLASPIALTRIAVGLQLLWPTSDREEAYQQITRLIGSTEFRLDGAKEFSYQINRPRRSTVVTDLEINRLMRWAAVRVSLYSFGTTPGRILSERTTNGIVLDLDLSTSEERSEALPPNVLLDLYRELLQSGEEISERGDVS